MNESNGLDKMFTSCLKALAVTVLAAALLLTVFTATAYGTEDPDKLVGTLSLTALYLSALIGGVVSARLSDMGVAAGAVLGVMTSLLVFLLSFLPVSSGVDRSIGVRAALCLAVTAVGAAGGLLGKKRGRRRPKYKTAARRR